MVPKMFKPLRFYCIWHKQHRWHNLRFCREKTIPLDKWKQCFFVFFVFFSVWDKIQLTLATSLISNNRLSWSENLALPKHENLTTCKKYYGKEKKLLGAISPLFHNIFNISLTSRVQLHIYLLNVVNRISFPQFCKSDMSKYGYLEVFQRVPWNSR